MILRTLLYFLLICCSIPLTASIYVGYTAHQLHKEAVVILETKDL